ncbi:MAG: hypothetical protein WDO19_28770 [Bacteroidota bacterium]
MKETIDPDIKMEIKDGQISFARPTDQIRHRAYAWSLPCIDFEPY